MPNKRFLLVAFSLTVTASGCVGRGYDAATSAGIPFAAFGNASPRLAKGSGYAYVATAAFNPGYVYVYALPLTSNSRPLWQIGDLNAPGAIGFDPHQVFVLVAGSPDAGQGILVYRMLKKGPVSFAVSTPLLPEMLEVDKGGDLFQGQSYAIGSSYGSYQINVFKYPIEKGSAPAFTMSTAVNSSGGELTRGMAFDPHGNLWVKDDDNQTMDKFAPPFSAQSKPSLTFPKGSGAAYGSMIFDATGTMFVTNGGGIDVYHPPFTKKTSKRFTIAAPNATVDLAVDPAGDLYVTSSTGVVSVFTPPFSASSSPAVTLTVPGSPPLPFISIRE